MAEIRSSIEIGAVEEPKSWEESSLFMKSLSSRIEEKADFSHFTEIDFNYNHSYEETLKEFPNQVVAIIVLKQPSWAKSYSGYVDPQSDVIVSKRSKDSSWGAGTWAIPMGKIDEKDTTHKHEALGEVIVNAAKRELNEEISRNSQFERSLITSSFLDNETGNLIHVVVTEINDYQQHTSSLSIGVSDEREHDEVGWARISELPHLSPVENGVKYVFTTALHYIDKINDSILHSRASN